jgi:hypothetical protein
MPKERKIKKLGLSKSRRKRLTFRNRSSMRSEKLKKLLEMLREQSEMLKN